MYWPRSDRDRDPNARRIRPTTDRRTGWRTVEGDVPVSDDLQSRVETYVSYLLAVLFAVMLVGMFILAVQATLYAI